MALLSSLRGRLLGLVLIGVLPSFAILVYSEVHHRALRVLDAGTPGDALQLAQEEPLHLLLSDVVLPGMDGWTLSRELVAGRPGLRVLFMSGYAAQPTGEPLLPDGAPLLAKPFAPEDLLREVRAVLDGPPDQGCAGASAAASAAKRSA